MEFNTRSELNGLPLSALLSQLSVAFTIECDNEYERQMALWEASRESLGERRQRTWTVSLVMWSNFMRFIGSEPIRVRDLEYLAHLANQPGLERWGYISISPDPADTRPKPPRSDWLVRPTPAGKQAQDVFIPLIEEIEARWENRFSKPVIDNMRESLLAITALLDVDLPEFLPILRYGLFSHLPDRMTLTFGPAYNAEISAVQFPALLSKVLLAFAIDFERESRLSLAICANVLRLLNDGGDSEPGVLLRDLPRMSGVSKEAMSMAVGYLVRNGFAALVADPAAKGAKSVRLLESGVAAKRQFERMLCSIANAWTSKFGGENVDRLRQSIEALYPKPGEDMPKLSDGLRPYPDGWRARKPYVTQTTAVIRDPVRYLPHFPMVLHRGGYPDGS